MTRFVGGQGLIAFRRRDLAGLVDVALDLDQGRHLDGLGHAENAPDAVAGLVARATRLVTAIFTTGPAHIRIGQVGRRNGRIPTFPASHALHVVKGRAVARFGILIRRQQQAALGIVFQEDFRVLAARGGDGVAEPQLVAVHQLGGVFQAVVQLAGGGRFDLAADVVLVQVLDAVRRDVGVAFGFDGGRFVGQRLRLPDRLARGIQCPADTQVCAGIDQGVFTVGERADTQVQVAARGDDGVGVVDERRRLDADAVAVNAAGVGQTASGDAGVAAIDEAGIGQHRADVQFGVAPRDQFAGGAVGQRVGGDRQVLARVELAVVVQVAGGQFQGIAGCHRTAAVDQVIRRELGVGVG
ncbi:hypothetical protein LMG3412_06519 [Achromobacter deleyi]|nr:hypothetical protein LMG3412_06519 [Achromobacter deleyi]